MYIQKISDEEVEGIDTTLRTLRVPASLSQSRWATSCLIAKHVRENPGIALHEAVLDVFTDVLKSLEEANRDYADLLHGLYWEGLTWEKMMEAQRPKAWSSSTTFSKYRKEAFNQFAYILWQKELACSEYSEVQNEVEIIHFDQGMAELPNKMRTIAPLTMILLASGIGLLMAVFSLVVWSGGFANSSGNRFPSTSTASVNETVLGECGNVPQTLPIPSGPESFNRKFGFTTYTVSNSSTAAQGGLLGNTIRSVFGDENGVWIGYGSSSESNGGVTYISNAVEGGRIWETCADARGTAIGRLVNAITRDNQGNLWIATDGDGVWRLRSGKWEQFIFNETSSITVLPHRATFTIVSHNNDIYVGTLTGVIKYSGSTWTKEAFMADERQVHAIAFAPNGDTWVGFITKGVRHIQFDGSWQDITSADDLSNDNVRSILIDNDERVWIATLGGGINVFQDDNLVATYRAGAMSLPSDNVKALIKDKFGRIWAGTDKGTSYFDGTRWNMYSNLDTYSIGFVKSTQERCSSDNDHVWIGTNGSGLTHSRLPARSSVISNVQITGIPVTLTPGQSFSPEVTVAIDAGYNLAAGDFLQVTDENSYTKNKQPKLAIPTDVIIEGGKSYTFRFSDDNAMIAPQEPGDYVSTWRLWQCGRYVGAPIRIEFTVQ